MAILLAWRRKYSCFCVPYRKVLNCDKEHWGWMLGRNFLRKQWESIRIYYSGKFLAFVGEGEVKQTPLEKQRCTGTGSSPWPSEKCLLTSILCTLCSKQGHLNHFNISSLQSSSPPMQQPVFSSLPSKFNFLLFWLFLPNFFPLVLVLVELWAT